MRRFLELFLTPIGLAALLLFALQSRSDAISGSCTTYRTWNTGDTLTAPDLTTSFQQVATTNNNGACLAGHSPDVATMQTATDPYAAATESLATSNDGELERIRFILQRMNGATSWYKETQFSGPGQHGRFTFGADNTHPKFCPFNGNLVRIPSTGKLYQIPSACVTALTSSTFVGGVAAQALAASTTYWVYLFDNSGTLTMDFWVTSTHTPDTLTGIEIRTADTTRILIGLIRTGSANQIVDDNTLRGIISWANRRAIGLVNNLTANRTGTQTSFNGSSEINSEIRGNFVTWADEAVAVGFSVSVTNNGASGAVATSVAFDGTTAENVAPYTQAAAANIQLVDAGTLTKNGLAEGFHYATLLGAVNAGTGTWIGGTAGALGTSSMTVEIRG